MNIALIGYGKMGHMIEAAAQERGHSIRARVDPFASDGDHKGIESLSAQDIDVAIEFTHPDTALSNIEALLKKKIPTVVGTTGWHDSMDKVRLELQNSDGALLWSSNFSLGVNIFYQIAGYAASLIDRFDEYDVGGWEAHHNKKADSPSGTAKTLVERVLSEMKRKTTPVWDSLDRPPKPEELHYPSLRLGSVPGTHSLFFDSTADTIELSHSARNREGFARGAVRAAEWLVSCPGFAAPAALVKKGLHTMDEVLADLLA